MFNKFFFNAISVTFVTNDEDGFIVVIHISLLKTALLLFYLLDSSIIIFFYKHLVFK